MAERSKARVCDGSPAGIAGSNPAGSMDVCVVCFTVKLKVKVKLSHDRPGQALGVPEG